MDEKLSRTSPRDGFLINLRLFWRFGERDWRWILRGKVLLRDSSDLWNRRRAAWLDHANTFTAIQCNGVSLGWNPKYDSKAKLEHQVEPDLKHLVKTKLEPQAQTASKEKPAPNSYLRWQATRIKFLSDHLDILDRKFGALLQFQALLGIVVNVLLSFKLKEVIKLGWLWGDWSFLLSSLIWVDFLCLIGCLWLIDTILCLTGIRRIVWGDMGEAVGSPPDIKQAEEVPDIKQAEEHHVNELIDEIIERTAKFRLAVVTTIANVILLLPLAGLIFGSIF